MWRMGVPVASPISAADVLSASMALFGSTPDSQSDIKLRQMLEAAEIAFVGSGGILQIGSSGSTPTLGNTLTGFAAGWFCPTRLVVTARPSSTLTTVRATRMKDVLSRAHNALAQI